MNQKNSIKRQLIFSTISYFLLAVFTFILDIPSLSGGQYTIVLLVFLGIWLFLVYISTRKPAEAPDEMAKEIMAFVNHKCLSALTFIVLLMACIGVPLVDLLGNAIGAFLFGILCFISAMRAVLFSRYDKNGLPQSRSQDFTSEL